MTSKRAIPGIFAVDGDLGLSWVLIPLSGFLNSSLGCCRNWSTSDLEEPDLDGVLPLPQKGKCSKPFFFLPQGRKTEPWLPGHSASLPHDWPLLSLSHPHQLFLPIRRPHAGLISFRGTEMKCPDRCSQLSQIPLKPCSFVETFLPFPG